MTIPNQIQNPLKNHRRHWIPFFLILLLWIGFWSLVAWNFPGDDFSSSYIASRLLSKNLNEYLYILHPKTYHLVENTVWLQTAKESGVDAFLHPYVQIPLLAWMIQPLANNLPYMTINRIFILLNLMSICGILVISGALWYPILLTPKRFFIALLLLSITTPIVYSIFLNQTHPIIIFFVLLAVYFERNHKTVSSGVMLAISTIIKLIPGMIAVYWFFTGRLKNSLAFFFSMICLFIFNIIFIGVPTLVDFLLLVRRISGITLVSYNNQSILGSILSIHSDPKEIFNWTMYPVSALEKGINYFVMGFGVLAIIYLRRKIKDPYWDSLADGMGWTAILILATIFSTIAWTHYFIILLFPILLLLEWIRRQKTYFMLLPVLIMYLLNVSPFAQNPLAPQLMPWVSTRSHLLAALLALACLYYCLIKITYGHLPTEKILSQEKASGTKNGIVKQDSG
jgi:Glycosyltransferase family 87